jgi:DNA repair exonuclease SbcCD ATPase subunit
MWIEQLQVQGIGPFQEEHTFFFDSGCSVVAGGNESGKTSLAQAIWAALFGFFPLHLPEEQGTSAWVQLTFRTRNRIFSLLRESPTNRVVLAETTNAEDEILFEGTTDDPDAAEVYRTQLALIVGFGADAVWSACGYVEDGELRTRLDEPVRTWLAGHRQKELEAVLVPLESELARLTGEAGPSDGIDSLPAEADDGELTRIREELERKRTEVQAWIRAARGFVESRESRQRAEEERDAIRARLEELKETRQSLDRFKDLSQERERLEAELQELEEEKKRIRQALEEEEVAQSRLEEEYEAVLNHPDDIEEIIQEWLAVLSRRQELERMLEKLPEEPMPIASRPSRASEILAALGLGVLAWLLCLGAGAPFLGFALSPVVVVAWLLFCWFRSRSARQVRLDEEEERVRLVAERDHLDEELRRIKISLRGVGDFESPASLRRLFRGFLGVQEKLDQARRSAAAERPLSEVVEVHERILNELQILDSQGRDLVGEAKFLSGIDAHPELLDDKLSDIEREKEDAEVRLRELAELLEQELDSGETLADPGRLARDVLDLETREAEAAERKAALRVAVEALGRLVRGDGDQELDRVARRASSHFQVLSLGRHTGVRFGGDLQPEVETAGEWLTGDRLSRAARAQLRFALRLAIHEEAGDHALPLVLDEPFLGWDDERLQRAGEIVRSLVASGKQAIILSSDPRLASWSPAALHLGTSRNGSAETDLQAA